MGRVHRGCRGRGTLRGRRVWALDLYQARARCWNFPESRVQAVQSTGVALLAADAFSARAFLLRLCWICASGWAASLLFSRGQRRPCPIGARKSCHPWRALVATSLSPQGPDGAWPPLAPINHRVRIGKQGHGSHNVPQEHKRPRMRALLLLRGCLRSLGGEDFSQPARRFLDQAHACIDLAVTVSAALGVEEHKVFTR